MQGRKGYLKGKMSKKDRKYRRIILPKDKRAETMISLLADDEGKKDSDPESIKATVMNFSEGGLGFSMLRKGFWKLSSLDMIIINSITGEPPFSDMTGLKLQIKWVLDNSELEHIGFGCEFKDIPEELRSRVREYIESF
jgi:c-di-GMP-binding flagellar brake protein YcgR